jgi:Ca-activated chloride channel family protein
VKLSGKLAGEEKTLDFPVDLARHSNDDSNAFVARIWATRRVGEIIDEIDLKGKNQELINELVTLAKDHGILTPYTSFFADDQRDFRDLTRGRSLAEDRMGTLGEASGERAFNQRLAKSDMQAAGGADAIGGIGFGGGGQLSSGLARGGHGAAGPAANAPASGGGFFDGNVTYYDAATDEAKSATNIRQIGRKTFFQRGERLVDSTVSAEEEKAARKIERFSREYFDLADRYGEHVNQYLALEETVVIKLDGTTYEW